MEPVCLPARDQDRENLRPGESRLLRRRYRMAMVWHLSVVVFLSKRYRLPLPKLPTNFHL